MCHFFRAAIWLFVVGAPGFAADLALPGFRFEFPKDHFSHPGYQTEWWYYTGNLWASDGHQFGFEITFFRFRPQGTIEYSYRNAVWDASEVYIANFAVSDISDGSFLHEERVNRAGPGLAGINEERRKIWNGNWSACWTAFNPVQQRLEAVSDHARVTLDLRALKPVVIHGRDRVGPTAPLRGEAWNYYSLTRISAKGSVSIGGKDYAVTGQAWMDQQFFSRTQGREPLYWDWFCIQLETGEDLMLFRLRSKGGNVSGYSSGTYISNDGKSESLDFSEISFRASKMWHSPQTAADYPLEWAIQIPAKGLRLRLTTPLENQELVNEATQNYWEGAVRYEGEEGQKAVRGVGYLEMTGYDPHGKKNSPVTQ
jgi:predicted secreted hydrolase